jgi:hypothetical protein
MLGSILTDIANAYDKGIVDAGKQPELFLLVAFLLSFGFIRTSAHLIRSQRFSWWPGNVEVGGTHIHHLVWGIVALLVFGYIGLAIAPPSPWREVVAVLFGIGAGLTLDEFALWLNLRDVYWSEEGRRSIDAVIVAAALGLIVLLGLRTLGRLAEELEAVFLYLLATASVAGMVLGLVNALKGKYLMAIGSVLVPLIGVIGAMRLARPTSPWARLYSAERLARARERFGHEGVPGRLGRDPGVADPRQ